MKENILQNFTYYDYSDVEIEYAIKTKYYDISKLTSILNIDPTRGFSINESYEGKELNEETRQVGTVLRNRPYTLWVLNTRNLTESTRFEEHVSQLLRLLTPQINNLKPLIEDKDNIEISTFIYLKRDAEQENFGFGSNASLLKQLADFSHYIEWRTK
jgi:hypothetical protein